MRATDSAERIIRPRRRRSHRITHPSEPLKILRPRRATTDTLTHAVGRELDRTRQLVDAPVLVSTHPMCERDMRRQIQIRATALMTDQPPIFGLVDAPVHPRPNRLTHTRSRLTSMLTTRSLVMTQTQATRHRVTITAGGRARGGRCAFGADPTTLRSPLPNIGDTPPVGVPDTHGTKPITPHHPPKIAQIPLNADEGGHLIGRQIAALAGFVSVMTPSMSCFTSCSFHEGPRLPSFSGGAGGLTCQSSTIA